MEEEDHDHRLSTKGIMALAKKGKAMIMRRVRAWKTNF